MKEYTGSEDFSYYMERLEFCFTANGFKDTPENVGRRKTIRLSVCSITSLFKVSKWAVNTTLTEILVLTSTSAKECYPRIHRLSLFSLPFSLFFSLALPLPLANQRR